jgi:hypothetical protein
MKEETICKVKSYKDNSFYKKSRSVADIDKSVEEF